MPSAYPVFVPLKITSPDPSILPDSWTSGATGLFSGITGGINSFGANLLPDLFAPSAQFAANNALAAQTLGYSLGPQTTLLGTLGAAGAGFGLGSLAGSLLFPNQPNISTGAGIGGGLGAAIGSVVPGIGTLLGGTIGSLLGGGIGSLFGGGRRTHASVYGKMEDVGFSPGSADVHRRLYGRGLVRPGREVRGRAVRAGYRPSRQPDRREPSGYCRGIA